MMLILDLQTFLDHQFPDHSLRVEAAGEPFCRLRLCVLEKHRRPGDTVSGPALMGLADAAVYLALLASKGLAYAPCVTSHLSIHFLRRPALRDLLAEATLLKIGLSLVVGDVRLFSDGQTEPVALATVTYSVPSFLSSTPS